MAQETPKPIDPQQDQKAEIDPLQKEWQKLKDLRVTTDARAQSQSKWSEKSTGESVDLDRFIRSNLFYETDIQEELKVIQKLLRAESISPEQRDDLIARQSALVNTLTKGFDEQRMNYSIKYLPLAMDKLPANIEQQMEEMYQKRADESFDIHTAAYELKEKISEIRSVMNTVREILGRADQDQKQFFTQELQTIRGTLQRYPQIVQWDERLKYLSQLPVYKSQDTFTKARQELPSAHAAVINLPQSARADQRLRAIQKEIIPLDILVVHDREFNQRLTPEERKAYTERLEELKKMRDALKKPTANHD